MKRLARGFAFSFALIFLCGCGSADYDRGYSDGKRDLENSPGFIDKFATGFQAGQGNPHENDEYNAGYYRAVTEVE